ncbi:MAG: variant-type mycofactocin precursor [Pelotomaculaceae bacterium]|uniref:Mycofactocin n=1 Tax=anaerobic digester metagenome TaxID=1263854 RepID=A0A485LV74_9ZZZZ|nr:mycofactocin precursor [Peptococcaceae bacterium]
MEQQKVKNDPETSRELNCSPELPPDAGQRETEDPAVLEEVIIETLAIDGICGVY